MIEKILSGFIEKVGDLIMAIVEFLGNTIGDAFFYLVKWIYQNIVIDGGFTDFDGITNFFSALKLTTLPKTLLTITYVLLAINIIIAGLKMMINPALGKESDSPNSFITRIIIAGIMVIFYVPIIKIVISFLNSFTSDALFTQNILFNTIDSNNGNLNLFGEFEEGFGEKMAQIGVTIGIYTMLIKDLLMASLVYVERFISFSVYILLGPICFAVYPNKDTSNLVGEWVKGIVSQVFTILLSMFVFNLFQRQLGLMVMGLADSQPFGMTRVAQLAVVIVLLELVKTSEQLVNMLGLRTIPSGDTARSFATGVLGSAMLIKSGFNVAKSIGKGAIGATTMPGKIIKTGGDALLGKGRHDGYGKSKGFVADTVGRRGFKDYASQIGQRITDEQGGKYEQFSWRKNPLKKWNQVRQENRALNAMAEAGYATGRFGLDRKQAKQEIRKAAKQKSNLYETDSGNSVIQRTGAGDKYTSMRGDKSLQKMWAKKDSETYVTNANGTVSLKDDKSGMQYKMHVAAVKDDKGNILKQAYIEKGKFDEDGRMYEKATLTDEEGTKFQQAVRNKEILFEGIDNANTRSIENLNQARENFDKKMGSPDYSTILDAEASTMMRGKDNSSGIFNLTGTSAVTEQINKDKTTTKVMAISKFDADTKTGEFCQSIYTEDYEKISSAKDETKYKIEKNNNGYTVKEVPSSIEVSEENVERAIPKSGIEIHDDRVQNAKNIVESEKDIRTGVGVDKAFEKLQKIKQNSSDESSDFEKAQDDLIDAQKKYFDSKNSSLDKLNKAEDEREDYLEYLRQQDSSSLKGKHWYANEEKKSEKYKNR